MTSRKIRLTTVAPLVVSALAVATALPATAQETPTSIYTPAHPQIASALPVDMVPTSIYTPAHTRLPVQPKNTGNTQLIARTLPLGLRHVTGSPYGSTHARRIASAVPVADELPETTSVVSRIDDDSRPLPRSEWRESPAPAVERNIAAAKLFSDPAPIAKAVSDAANKVEFDSPLAFADLRPVIPQPAVEKGTIETAVQTRPEKSETPAAPPDAVPSAGNQIATTADANHQPNDYDMSLEPISIAQSVPTDTIQDTGGIDLTPVNLPMRRPNFNRFEGFKSSLLYGLPGKMFFTTVVDNSLRLETNVFQTANSRKSDMIYRVLPNTVLGYALTRTTRVSANYFFLRDQYTRFSPLLNRNFHAVGFQVDQDLVPPTSRTRVTLGFMGRALFADLEQFNETFFNDLLPQLTVSRQINPHINLYGQVLGQIRFREMLSQFQEGDQFYVFGGYWQKGAWTAQLDNTLNCNFGNSNLRQGNNNQVFILTQELARRISTKIPLQAYVRTQEIFNIGANSSPGYAGYNFRVFGGVRLYIVKPIIYPVKIAGAGGPNG